MRKLSRKIEEIRYYACGHCVNDLKLVFKEHKREKAIFPAGVFLIKHSELGYILYDTGYGMKIYDCGIKGVLYNALNPTTVTAADEIGSQLERDGIALGEIKTVIISHLHPDHIGGLYRFPNADIIVSAGEMSRYSSGLKSLLIFKKLLPPWFEERVKTVSSAPYKWKAFKNAPEIKMTVLPGHSCGQLCLLIDNKMFLGADSCWGREYLGERLTATARLIQDDMRAYKRTTGCLNRLGDKNVDIFFSHDRISEKFLYKKTEERGE